MLIPAWMLVSIGVVPSAVLGLNLIIGVVPRERAGMTLGLSQSVNELGAALGIGLLGALGTAVFRSRFSGIGPDDSLGAVLDSVAADSGRAAQAAFLDGMHVVALVAAVMLLIAAPVIARLLRDTPEPELDQAATMDLILTTENTPAWHGCRKA